MMKIKLISIILTTLFFTVCQSRKDVLTKDKEQEISDSLKNIAVEFLRSWEPPFYPDKALNLFTQTDDFCLIIDGHPIKNYAQWAKGIPDFMSDDDSFFSSYSHDIKDIKTVVLNRETGVVTIIYIWDSITKEGIHRKTNGAITLTCRLEKDGWKIIHYHGSHGEDRIMENPE